MQRFLAEVVRGTKTVMTRVELDGTLFAVAAVEQKAKDLLAQADAHRELSSNLAHDDA